MGHFSITWIDMHILRVHTRTHTDVWSINIATYAFFFSKLYKMVEVRRYRVLYPGLNIQVCVCCTWFTYTDFIFFFFSFFFVFTSLVMAKKNKQTNKKQKKNKLKRYKKNNNNKNRTTYCTLQMGNILSLLCVTSFFFDSTVHSAGDLKWGSGSGFAGLS